MKKNSIYIRIMALGLFMFLFSACSSLKVSPEIICSDKTCTVIVGNKEKKEVSYSMNVLVEIQGMKMVPVFDTKYVDNRFLRWERPGSTIFSVNDTVVENGHNSYTFDIPDSILKAPGQTLITVQTRTEAPNPFSTNYGKEVVYTTFGKQDSVEVTYNVTCNNGLLDLTIRVPETAPQGDRTYAVYADNELEDPITYINVRSGDAQRIAIPLANGIKLLQVTVYGHADGHGNDRIDFHRNRAYCVVPQNQE